MDFVAVSYSGDSFLGCVCGLYSGGAVFFVPQCVVYSALYVYLSKLMTYLNADPCLH